jgi:hypothetical protein
MNQGILKYIISDEERFSQDISKEMRQSVTQRHIRMRKRRSF